MMQLMRPVCPLLSLLTTMSNKPFKTRDDYYNLPNGQVFYMAEAWFEKGEVVINIHKCVKISNDEFEAHDYYDDKSVSDFRIHNKLEHMFEEKWKMGNSYFYFKRPIVSVVHCDENSPKPVFNENFKRL